MRNNDTYLINRPTVPVILSKSAHALRKHLCNLEKSARHNWETNTAILWRGSGPVKKQDITSPISLHVLTCQLVCTEVLLGYTRISAAQKRSDIHTYIHTYKITQKVKDITHTNMQHLA